LSDFPNVTRRTLILSPCKEKNKHENVLLTLQTRLAIRVTTGLHETAERDSVGWSRKCASLQYIVTSWFIYVAAPCHTEYWNREPCGWKWHSITCPVAV